MKEVFDKVRLIIATIVLVQGCALMPERETVSSLSRPEIKDADVEPHRAIPKNWWYVRFKKSWPESEPAAWHYDLLLAHQVILPILTQYREGIELWRFHRRAHRDDKGAQFSFIFYSSVSDASNIYAAIRQHDLLNELLAMELLESMAFEDLTDLSNQTIADTSDVAWPIEMQQVWPYYIMGASQTWLSLVDIIYHQQTPAPDDLDAMVETYQTVSNIIDLGWMRYGKHAFLHHINALFGYVPLQVRF